MLAWEVVGQGDPDRGSTFSAGAFPDTNLIQGVNKNDWRLNLSTIQSGIENRLWSMADELRANSQLRPSEYSTPVLGLIFLWYADHKFTQAEQEIGETGSTSSTDLILEYQARGVFYLLEKARFQHLLDLPEGEDIARAINDAMRMIEGRTVNLMASYPRPTTDSKEVSSLNCSALCHRSRWTSRAMSLAKSTSISWATLPWQKGQKAVSFSPHLSGKTDCRDSPAV